MDPVDIGDHFCLSLTMQGHLQTAGTERSTPQCDATTKGTVSVYLIHIYIVNRKEEHSPITVQH